jgi:hypothetical protein
MHTTCKGKYYEELKQRAVETRSLFHDHFEDIEEAAILLFL